MANATPALSKLVLDHLFGVSTWTPPAQTYLALYTDVDTESEVTGGSYARQAIDSPAVVTGEQQTENEADVTFTGMPACTVRAISICDATTAGNKLLTLALTSPVPVTAGDSVTFGAGTVTTKAL